MTRRSPFNALNSWVSKKLAKLRRCCEGMAAVEFAMLVPIMLACYLGVVELGQALTVNRRITDVANSVADLVAQSEKIQSSDIEDIYKIAEAILEPYDTSSLEIVITSVVADDENKTTVDWSLAYNGGTPKTQGSTYSLPVADMTQPFSSVIIAEVKYSYDSPVSHYVTGPLDLEDTFYLRPRKSLKVTLEN